MIFNIPYAGHEHTPAIAWTIDSQAERLQQRSIIVSKDEVCCLHISEPGYVCVVTESGTSLRTRKKEGPRRIKRIAIALAATTNATQVMQAAICERAQSTLSLSSRISQLTQRISLDPQPDPRRLLLHTNDVALVGLQTWFIPVQAAPLEPLASDLLYFLSQCLV